LCNPKALDVRHTFKNQEKIDIKLQRVHLSDEVAKQMLLAYSPIDHNDLAFPGSQSLPGASH
jgi:hypothetical protein